VLAFLTTLRHPHNSADYGRVEDLLSQTLASIVQQTCDDYVVIIVGNRQPSFTLPPRTYFVEADYPPPTQHNGPRTGMGPYVWDRGTKTGLGLVAARELAPDYVMFFDADDFLHRDLAGYVHDHPGSPGWVLRRGWVYSRSRNAYQFRRRMFRVCGTSFIIPYSAYAVPEQLTPAATQEEIAAGFGYDALEEVIAGHRYALEWWQERGRALQTLPFAGAVYQVDTGENHSGSTLQGLAYPYRPHLLDEFAIRPSKSPAATWYSAIGPAAFKPDLRPKRPAFLRPRTPALTRAPALPQQSSRPD